MALPALAAPIVGAVVSAVAPVVVDAAVKVVTNAAEGIFEKVFGKGDGNENESPARKAEA